MFDDLPFWTAIILIVVLVIGLYIVERVRGRNPHAANRRRNSGSNGGDGGGSQHHDYDGSDSSDGGDGGGGD